MSASTNHMLEPLRHHAYVVDDDDQLEQEAKAHLAKLPPLQLITELVAELRRCEPPWWRPEQLRQAWPTKTRMAWLSDRPDVRQRITTRLTGLPPRAARTKSAAFQAELIDAVVDEGDVDVRTFEHAFAPEHYAVYGPAEDLWHTFRAQLPVEDEGNDLERFTGWLLRALLSSKSPSGLKRLPVLTPLAVRTAIDGRVWHSRMPLDIRVAIDDARFRQERQRPGKAFCARHDLAIALPEHVAAYIPLRDLTEVLNRAEVSLGFSNAPQQEMLPMTYAPGRMTSMPISSTVSSAPASAADSESPEIDVSATAPPESGETTTGGSHEVGGNAPTDPSSAPQTESWNHLDQDRQTQSDRQTQVA